MQFHLLINTPGHLATHLNHLFSSGSHSPCSGALASAVPISQDALPICACSLPRFFLALPLQLPQHQHSTWRHLCMFCISLLTMMLPGNGHSLSQHLQHLAAGAKMQNCTHHTQTQHDVKNRFWLQLHWMLRCPCLPDASRS